MTESLPFDILRRYVKQAYIEAPNMPFALVVKTMPNVFVNVHVHPISMENKLYETKITIGFEASKPPPPKSSNENASSVPDEEQPENLICFSGTLIYCCLVKIQAPEEEMTNEAIAFTTCIKAPELMFPYIRHYIARLTRETGFPPLFINQIDFKEQFFADQEQKRIEKEMQE